MRGMKDPSEWQVLDLNSEYAAGNAWNRLNMLLKDDVYVSFFTDDVKSRMCNLFFSDGVLGMDRIIVDSPAMVFATAYDALDASPLAKLLTYQFKTHIAGLVRTAVFAPNH